MAEFDEYALNYDLKKSSPVKRLLGIDDETLVRQKSELVSAHLRGAAGRILDFGCGTGDLLASLISNEDKNLQFFGTDISSDMIAEAKKKFPSHASRFSPINELNLDFDAGQFDAIIMSSVLHHVAPFDLKNVLKQAIRLLRPKGKLIVLEHNSLNPITQLAVSMTPVDRNAQLLKPQQLSKLLGDEGLDECTIRYFLFCPPGWPLSSKIDSFLKMIPLGGQWILSACRED